MIDGSGQEAAPDAEANKQAAKEIIINLIAGLGFAEIAGTVDKSEEYVSWNRKLQAKLDQDFETRKEKISKIEHDDEKSSARTQSDVIEIRRSIASSFISALHFLENGTKEQVLKSLSDAYITADNQFFNSNIQEQHREYFDQMAIDASRISQILYDQKLSELVDGSEDY